MIHIEFSTLLLCTAHTYLYGWNKFLSSSTYKWCTLTGYMLCLVLPSVVLLLKLLLMDRTIIRQGWEGGGVYICGESVEAKQAVMAVATKLGFSALDRGFLSVARELEDFPLQLFPQWRLPLYIATGLSAAFFFYLLIRDIIYAYVTQGKDISFRIMVSLANKIRENRTTEFDTTTAWRGDSYLSLGILGFSLYVLLGITSIPSVSNVLSWREFSFIQSKLGHLTLLLCTAHTYLYGWNKFLSSSTYKWYTPPGYMLCLVLPSVVLLLKLLLITPCVDRTITRIRQGWERGADQRNPKDSQPLIP
ncbi:metalloreductase STEAP4-like [Oncorhynchus mykiss]|uniref:metalloreductase STEAP4-like n=1 Tax=Oncorhynchus mykiss TaxID=8022 RepID=UPI001878ED1F|nr:metalloreductase STEAP4-like [Oncorhynchus mykiss]